VRDRRTAEQSANWGQPGDQVIQAFHRVVDPSLHTGLCHGVTLLNRLENGILAQQCPAAGYFLDLPILVEASQRDSTQFLALYDRHFLAKRRPGRAGAIGTQDGLRQRRVANFPRCLSRVGTHACPPHQLSWWGQRRL
jgi:hypothetical protein